MMPGSDRDPVLIKDLALLLRGKFVGDK
jgi:hypothetical protein